MNTQTQRCFSHLSNLELLPIYQCCSYSTVQSTAPARKILLYGDSDLLEDVLTWKNCLYSSKTLKSPNLL